MESPKVFVSHSSADKERVSELAKRLRESGVDAWYADWEIGPGNSFVQKIDQGLGDCDKFIIVISKDSVVSRWVREELSSAVVRRIEGEAEIIPVRLDETPVPTVINHLHWVRMPPFRDEFEKLLKAIFGVSDRPPVGVTPEFVRRGLEHRQTTISGFSSEASAILRYLVLKVDLFDAVTAAELAKALDLNEVELDDGIDELEEHNLIGSIEGTLVEVTPKAPAWLYVDSEDLGFDPLRDMLTVAQCVVGHERVDAGTLEADTRLPSKRINIAALILQTQGNLKLIQPLGTAPFLFAEAWATRQTRQWVRDNQ